MAPLKDKKKKKKPKMMARKPAAKPPLGAVYKTGLNRDIPLGGAGGSQNLLANLLSSRQAQPAAVIQTPDQFKLAQDIKSIKVEQANIAEEQQAEKRRQAKYAVMRDEDKDLKAQLSGAEVDKKLEEQIKRLEAKEKFVAKVPSNLREAAGAEPPMAEKKQRASRAKKAAAAAPVAPVAPVIGADMPADPSAEVYQPFVVEPNAFPASGRGLRTDGPGKIGGGYARADYTHSLVGEDGGGLDEERGDGLGGF